MLGRALKLLVLLLAILAYTSLLCAENQRCPGPPRWMKQRLKKEVPWLVSPSLRRHIAKRSPEFGSLVKYEQQCQWSEAASLVDPSMEGRYFTTYVWDGIPLRSMFGRYRGIWTMAVVPMSTKDEVPNGNLLEITKHKWTLFHRDRDGSRKILATEHF